MDYIENLSTSVVLALKNERDFDVPQYCYLQYPFEEYEYIKVHFLVVEQDEMKYVLPISDEKISEYPNNKSCYFIYCPMNWYNKHDVRIKSDYSSSQWGLTTLNQEFSYDLYKLNVIDQMLVAVVDEKDNLIEFEENTDKEKINLNLLDFSVEKLIRLNIKKRPYNVNLDELSKKSYLYNRYNLLSGSGKHTGGIAPKPPAAMILKNLADKYPHRSPEDLMFMDDLILEMFEVLDTQELIKQHESRTVNENVANTNAKRLRENKGQGNQIPGWGVEKSSVQQQHKSIDRNVLNKKLSSKLEDVGHFRKK